MSRLSKAVLWTAAGSAVMVVIVVFAFGWKFVAYRPTQAGYLATVRSAATRLPIAVQFETLFPGQTDHFITHYGFNYLGGNRTNVWNSEALFAGRYILTMQMDVVVDYENDTVTPAGSPTFYLNEITRWDGSSAYHDGVHATFGEREWQGIYDKGGDFSVVGVAIQLDAPVPNIQEYINLTRNPRIPISLLDEPNK